jgi:hypothetical protein
VSLWRNARARLFVSHAIAGIVGVAVGFAYTTKMSTSTQTVLQGFKRRPLLDAVNVAFHFGSPDQAREACRHLRGSDCTLDELRALARQRR